MAEIKHTFTSGRMNKDLDERLIPNGEYRDALNIKVSSSEDSNVGAIEGLLGNIQISKLGIDNSTAIGSIEDTANNKIYWFITSSNVDSIFEQNTLTNNFVPVIVDLKSKNSDILNSIVSSDLNNDIIFENINSTELKQIIGNDLPTEINGEALVLNNVFINIPDIATNISIPKNTVLKKNESGLFVFKNIKYNNKKISFSNIEFVYYSNNILNFSKNNLITGINIIDGLLFFTDNINPPRRINIKDFISFSAGAYNAKTVVKYKVKNKETNQILEEQRPFTEDDISVAKKAPFASPDMELFDSLIEGTTEISNFKNLFDVEINDTIELEDIGINLSWEAENIVEVTSPKDSEVKITTEVSVVSDDNATLKVISIEGDITDESLNYNFSLLEKDPIYELSFVRFAYRWKYKDGEYSAISPFTVPAFIPDRFLFDGREAYNKAMSNQLQKVILSNFNLGDSNVEKIDILFKEARNNNIYVLQSINKEDFDESFEIKKEQIHSVLPNDQLLRQWDNVPRKAKAQEVTANRVIYGNYVQNFDIFTDPKFKIESYNRGTLSNRSVKSNRTYQIGVVYMDDYNRHSPILSNDSGSYTVSSKSCNLNNGLSIKITTPPPAWAKYYKYYIKDVSGEYYNLAADRFYKDEENNFVYISFPSSDVNKIDKDSYLYLKKYHGSDESVKENNKYKVIDIFNEPPEIVHEKLQQIDSFQNVLFNPTYGDGSIVGKLIDGATPTINNTKILIGSANKNNSYDTTNLAGHNPIGDPVGINDSDLVNLKAGKYIKFYTDNNKRTKAYKISAVKIDEPGAKEVQINIEPPFGDDVNILYDDNNDKTLKRNIEMRIYEDSLNAGDAEFNGRFFVKLRSNYVLDQAIENESINTDDGTNLFKKYTINFDGKSTGAGYENEASKTPSTDCQLIWTAEHNPNPNLSGEGGGGFGDAKSWAHVAFSQYNDNQQDEFFNAVVPGGFIKFDNDKTNFKIGRIRKYTYKEGKERLWIEFVDNDGNRLNNTNIPSLPNNGEQTRRSASFMVEADDSVVLYTSDPAIFETEPKEQKTELDIYYETEKAFPISDHGNSKELEWYNAFSFNNGVESNRIRDDFNGIFIDTGVRASSVIEEQFKEEHKFNGIIWSGIINSRSGINQSNQFNIANPITKDLLPSYGAIQKMHAWDDQLVMLCENKIVRAWADKDQLYNADGSTNLIASNNVIGSINPYNGDYGISNNPESFASYGFRCYFTDKKRGVVLRLSKDGLTSISAVNMSTFFEDRLYAQNGLLLGSFDENNKLYNITFNSQDTVCFSEAVNGWVTRKSYKPEYAASINGKYYTFKKNEIWEHDRKDGVLNTFYGDTVNSNESGNSSYSKVVFELNDSPSVIKKFKTLSYEGNKGWNAEIQTDQQKSSKLTFKEKENKYFSNITGESKSKSNLDLKNFSFQGIGKSIPASDAEYTSQIGSVADTTATINLNISGADSLPIYVKDIKNISITKQPGSKTSSHIFYVYPEDGYYIAPNSLEYSNNTAGSSMVFEYIDDYVKATLNYELEQPTADKEYNFLVFGKTLQKEVVVKGTYTYNLPYPWQLDVPLTGSFEVKGTPGQANVQIKMPTVFLGDDDLDLHLIEFNSTYDSDIIIEANSHVNIAVSKQNNNVFKVMELITIPQKSIENLSYVINVKSTNAPPVINYLIQKTFDVENFTLTNDEESRELKILASLGASYNIKFERTVGSPVEVLKETTVVHAEQQKSFSFDFPQTNSAETYKITISEKTNTESKDSFGDKVITFSRAARVQKEANLLIKYNQNSNTTLTYNAFVGETINSQISFGSTNYITLPSGTYIIPKFPLNSNVNFGKNKNKATINFDKFEFNSSHTNRLIIEGTINIESIVEDETYILDLTQVLGTSTVTTFDYSIGSSGNYTDSPASYTETGAAGLIKNPDNTQYLFTLTPSSNFVFKQTISGNDFEIVDSSNNDVSSLYAANDEIKLLKENNLIKVGFDTKSYTVPSAASTILVRPKTGITLTEADVTTVAKKYILDIELIAESTQSSELTYTENFAKTFKNIDSASTNILYQFIYNDKEISNLRNLLNNNIIGAIHSGQFSNFVFSNTNNTEVTLVSSSGGTFTNTDGNSVTVAGPYSYDATTNNLTVNLLINLSGGGDSANNKVSLKIFFDHLKQYDASNNLIDKYKLIAIYPQEINALAGADCNNLLPGPLQVSPGSYSSINSQDNSFPKFYTYNGAPLAKGTQIFVQKENEIAPGNSLVWGQGESKAIIIKGKNTLFRVGKDNVKGDGIILENPISCPNPNLHLVIGSDGSGTYIAPSKSYYPDVILHKTKLYSTLYKNQEAKITGKIKNIDVGFNFSNPFHYWAIVTGQIAAAKNGLQTNQATLNWPGIEKSAPIEGLTIKSIRASKNNQPYSGKIAWDYATPETNPLAENVEYSWEKNVFFDKNGVAELEYFSYRGKRKYLWDISFDNLADIETRLEKSGAQIIGYGHEIPYMARRTALGVSEKYDIGPETHEVDKYSHIQNTCYQDIKVEKFGNNNSAFDSNPYCPIVDIPETSITSDKYLINQSTDDLIFVSSAPSETYLIGVKGRYKQDSYVTAWRIMFNNEGNKLNFENDPSEGMDVRGGYEYKNLYIKVKDVLVNSTSSHTNNMDPEENPPYESPAIDGPTVVNINGQKYAKAVFSPLDNFYNIWKQPNSSTNPTLQNTQWRASGSIHNFLGIIGINPFSASNDYTEGSDLRKTAGKWVQGSIFIYGYKEGAPGYTEITLDTSFKNYDVVAPGQGTYANTNILKII